MGIMKKAIYLIAAATVLTSFTFRSNDDDDSIDGLWMGYYRSDLIKEKVIVKFNGTEQIEFYTGGVDERTKTTGSYRLQGDSVSFTYKTPDGASITMEGHFNRRKNFVDGVWNEDKKTGGSFYLEKQKIQEYYAAP